MLETTVGRYDAIGSSEAPFCSGCQALKLVTVNTKQKLTSVAYWNSKVFSPMLVYYLEIHVVNPN